MAHGDNVFFRMSLRAVLSIISLESRHLALYAGTAKSAVSYSHTLFSYIILTLTIVKIFIFANFASRKKQ